VALVGGDFLQVDHPFQKFANSADAKAWWQQQQFENTHVLIKGSRSMKMEEVLKD
jgi:UDP-N-acetylmuramoyl-tripeptide--D-alanyl-D-alanine ligase